MLWLEKELEALATLLIPGTHPSISQAPTGELRRRATGLVDSLVARQGITAAFIAHEGFVFCSAGDGVDFEALAAIAQEWATLAASSVRRGSLGDAHQIVVVGADRKLAVVPLNNMVLGITCPSHIPLASLLAASS